MGQEFEQGLDRWFFYLMGVLKYSFHGGWVGWERLLCSRSGALVGVVGRWGLAETVNILMPACGVHALSNMVASWSLLSFLYVSSGQHDLLQLRSLAAAAPSLFVEAVTSLPIFMGKGTQIPPFDGRSVKEHIAMV